MKTIQILLLSVLSVLMGTIQVSAQKSGKEIMEAVYNNPTGDDVQGSSRCDLSTNRETHGFANCNAISKPRIM